MTLMGLYLGTPTRRPAVETFVACTVADHQGSTLSARGGILLETERKVVLRTIIADGCAIAGGRRHYCHSRLDNINLFNESDLVPIFLIQKF